MTDNHTDRPVVGLTIPQPGTISLQPADAVPSRFGGFPHPDQPAHLGAGEVAGATICTLLSPGTEIANSFSPADLSTAPPYPWIPGYAAVWRIDEIGADVHDLAVGDLVFSMGGHRSRQRESHDLVWRLPEGLDPFRAVFARLMAVPMASLTTATARPGARVGVSGLGPIGHFAAIALAASGYDVTAWDPQPERVALLPAGIRGLVAAPDPVAENQYGTTEGFELVLECSGHDGASLAAARTVRSNGELVLVGTPWRRRTDATAHELLREVFFRYVVLRSGWEWQIPSTPQPFVTGSTDANVRLALRWLADGTADPGELAERHRPEDAQSVYSSFASANASRLTAVFDWS